MAEEDSLADERLWMYITTIDEARDTAHKNITKIKYISAQKPINYQYIDYWSESTEFRIQVSNSKRRQSKLDHCVIVQLTVGLLLADIHCCDYTLC